MRLAFAAVFALIIAATTSAPAPARATVDLELWRLDCGRFDVKNIAGRPRTLANGCYLIRHGGEYLIWDTGLEETLIGKPDVTDHQTISLERALLPQLAQIGVKAEQISRVGVSHHHGDHYGQAERFSSATLLIGREDWAEIRSDPEKAGLVTPWIEGRAKLVELDSDYDVFGDGRVVILDTPGHTIGHKALLVHLASGAVLLTGDAVHFREQLQTRRPSGNHVDKIRGAQSIERMLLIERQVPARIIVQHDPGDVELTPAFPESLK